MPRSALVIASGLAALALAPLASLGTDRLAAVDHAPLANAVAQVNREPRAKPIVQDEPGARDADAQGSRISEYIEMHGRATDSSGRATLMPWSALKQIAN